MLCIRSRAHLIVTDVQEKLVPHVAEPGAVMRNVARLIGCARRLDVPVTLTEHNPDGLGPTVPAIREAAGTTATVVRKATFSALREPAFLNRVQSLRQDGRDQLVLCGMEAHVCVLQTALEAIAADLDVIVVADAVASRDAAVKALALDRLRQAGATIAAFEMVAFEWLEQGGTPEFRDLLALIK
jgi:nicotinamidase-related amidase